MRSCKRPTLKLITNISVCLLILSIIGGMACVASRQPVEEPYNPISDNRAISSHMLLNASTDSSIGTDEKLLLNTPQVEIYSEAGSKNEKTQDQQYQENQTGDTTLKQENKQQGSDEAQDEEYSDSSEALQEGSTSVIYFTTSIRDGSSLSERDYSFTITHKIKDLKVKEVAVYVNEIIQTQFKGHVLLSEGTNTIRVSVQYINDKNELIAVYKDYKLNVNTGGIIISTDLYNQKVDSPELSFNAEATLDGKSVLIKVKLNNMMLDEDNGTYMAALNEGDNEITLSAGTGEKSASQSYTITYSPPEILTIKTSLKNETVNDSTYGFTAEILGGTEKARLTVVVNGKALTADGESYTTQLITGTNTIRLKATDTVKGEKIAVTDIYYVKYVPKTTEETAPNIKKINITDGMSIVGSSYTLDVTPVDYLGSSIYYDGITVRLNGSIINYKWASGGTTSYLLSLAQGKNSIDIHIKDSVGRYKDYSYVINCQQVEKNQPIGKATISIQASTLGLGYIVNPIEVDIFEGEPASYVVVRLLEECGITPSYSGSMDIGFYLSRISKKGIGTGVEIPQDLVDAINEDGLEWKEQHFDDSIGELDYCQGSGWMYSVNGYYPNHGLSECHLKDGDVIRIRFTLAYGKDIGGYGSSGGEGAENYDKEW